MTLSEELAWRGFVNQTTFKDISVLDGEPLKFYLGVDPSASSMTIGNLAAVMMVRKMMKHGHQAVLLVGGATGLIGDPDGKAEERTLKTDEEVTLNKQGIAAQYAALLNDMPFESVDNYDWFKGMGYLEFLRVVGKHVPMRQMMQREFVQSRLGEDGAGISYAEFSYVLIQAYDFLYLNREKGVSLQICGSDQWGNSIAGVDLIRRISGKETHVWSMPLVINKATGKKFGKTEDGAIWLDPERTSATQFFQFWINADDDGVEEYLKIYTEIDKDTMEDILFRHRQDPGKRLAQKELAKAVTTLVHGAQQTMQAEAVTEILTGQRTIGEADEAALAVIRLELPAVAVAEDGSVLQAAVEGGMAVSISEARRLLQGNAFAINGIKVSRETFEPGDFNEGKLLLKKGKKFKDTMLVELR